MKKKKPHFLVNLVVFTLAIWGVFQTFYFLKYGHETQFGDVLSVFGAALFVIYFITLTVHSYFSEEKRYFSLYLLGSVFTGFMFLLFL
jgi:hypothetical protein